VRVVKNIHTGKSRGYAFIEFRDQTGAQVAYDKADGRRLDGKFIMVDWDLARIDKRWLPRRLGGGKGGETRKNKAEEDLVRELRKEIRSKS